MTGTTTTTELEPFLLDDEHRMAIRSRLAEQIRRAWAVADLAGLRLAGWASTEHREQILERRIAALRDSELVALWDGNLPEDEVAQPDPVEVMAEVRARTFTCGRVQIQLPHHLRLDDR